MDWTPRRELRASPRRQVHQRAWIGYDDGPLTECVLKDISEGGAKIVSIATSALPDEFTLFFTPEGKIQRTCRVRWRNGFFIGVMFATDASERPRSA